jgi:hypothetical protein
MPFYWRCDLCHNLQITDPNARSPHILVLDEGTGKEQDIWLCEACWKQNQKLESQG